MLRVGTCNLSSEEMEMGRLLSGFHLSVSLDELWDTERLSQGVKKKEGNKRKL